MSDTTTRADEVPNAAHLGRPIRILLVEDSPGDVRLCVAALRRAHVANELHHVPDGEQAMRFLCRKPPYEDAPRPDLVLLDLNMPRMDGREVLVKVKSIEKLRSIPVVVLTTSQAERDVIAAYDRYAAGYVNKPVDFEQFVEVIRRLEGFWLNVVLYSPPHNSDRESFGWADNGGDPCGDA